MKPTLLVSSALKKVKAADAGQNVIVGFDGFVDTILRIVEKRQSANDFSAVETIKAFGHKILGFSGLSGNIELVPQQVKLGGNGPIMANALVASGYTVDFIGAAGKEHIHPAFKGFIDQCRNVISLADPGLTDALEFNDGKLMLGKLASLEEVSWEKLLETLGETKLQEMVNDAALISCTNWTMLSGMNTILKGMKDVVSNSSSPTTFFVDLADPQKRTPEDVKDVLNILSDLQSAGDMILGLNENESKQISEVLFGHVIDDLSERAESIRAELGISMCVVHPSRSCCVASACGEQAFIEGPYTEAPKLTTGAGDNFNAGFCIGLLSGCSPTECLATGVCTSGFYVRNCHSPSRDELTSFMQAWLDTDCGDMD